MIAFARHQSIAAVPPPHADTALAMERLGVTPVAIFAAIPAAWPSGVSSLTITYDVCQGLERVEMRNDWTAGIRA